MIIMIFIYDCYDYYYHYYDFCYHYYYYILLLVLLVLLLFIIIILIIIIIIYTHSKLYYILLHIAGTQQFSQLAPKFAKCMAKFYRV